MYYMSMSYLGKIHRILINVNGKKKLILVMQIRKREKSIKHFPWKSRYVPISTYFFLQYIHIDKKCVDLG